MKYMLFLLLCIAASQHADAQQVVKTRYLNAKNKEVEENKAKYLESVIRNADGSLSYQRKVLKSGVIVRSEHLKDDVPVGKWFYAKENGSVFSEYDYDFELSYTDTGCHSAYRHVLDTDTLMDSVPGRFEAPKLQGATNIRYFLAEHLNYPEASREAGIEGRVIIRGVINERGMLEGLSVLKGPDRLLEKEAARVLHLARFSPPRVEGKPARVCVTVPVKFNLE